MPLSFVVGIAVCLFYLMALGMSVLVSMALGAVSCTVFCSLAAHEVSAHAASGGDGDDASLARWLLLNAGALIAWTFAASEIVNHYRVEWRLDTFEVGIVSCAIALALTAANLKSIAIGRAAYHHCWGRWAAAAPAAAEPGAAAPPPAAEQPGTFAVTV